MTHGIKLYNIFVPKDCKSKIIELTCLLQYLRANRLRATKREGKVNVFT